MIKYSERKLKTESRKSFLLLRLIEELAITLDTKENPNEEYMYTEILLHEYNDKEKKRKVNFIRIYDKDDNEVTSLTDENNKDYILYENEDSKIYRRKHKKDIAYLNFFSNNIEILTDMFLYNFDKYIKEIIIKRGKTIIKGDEKDYYKISIISAKNYLTEKTNKTLFSKYYYFTKENERHKDYYISCFLYSLFKEKYFYNLEDDFKYYYTTIETVLYNNFKKVFKDVSFFRKKALLEI